MKFDKLSLFADGQTIPTTANTTTYSDFLDLRNCGQVGIDGMLKIWVGVIGTVNATGSVTTKLQTSADGATWADLVSETQNSSLLMAVFLPCKGLKRFVRLAFVVGSTALGSAVVVKGGLVDQFDNEDIPSIPAYPPLADLNDAADRIRKALKDGIKLSSSAGTGTKSTAATVETIYITNTLGTVSAAVTSAGSTSTYVTATQDATDATKWVIATTASVTAGTYLVTFTDASFGKTAVYTVTVPA